MTTTRRRTALLLAAVALGAAACAGPAASSTGTTSAGGSSGRSASPTSTTSTTEVPPLGAGQVGTPAQIPWGAVGNGWYVATWSTQIPGHAGESTTTSPPVPTSVFLVDPEGGRYLEATLPATSDDVPVSWSGDAKRVLFESRSGIRELDLTSGDFSAAIPIALRPHNFSMAYTFPHGDALIGDSGAAGPASPPSLDRYSLSGRMQQSYPTTFSEVGTFTGEWLESPDGTTIVMAAKNGIAVVGNDGTVERQLTGPGYSSCVPVRWWTSTRFVVQCSADGRSVLTLSIVDTSGGAPTPITTYPTASWDSSDLDAWTLGGTTFVQVAMACGRLGVGTVTASKQTAELTIPQVPDGSTTLILGSTPTALSLESLPSCGHGGMLLTYTPSSNTSDILLGGPVNGGSVLDALAFPGIDDPTVQ